MKKSILSVLLFFASTGLAAEETQSPEELTDKIKQFALNELSSYKEGTIHVFADKIDSRLSFKACADHKLVVFNPYQTPILNTSALGIKCMERDNHWSLYVPIRITILKTVYVASRSLMKGEQIGNSDLYQAEIDVHKLKHGYFDDIDNLIGRVCKQNVAINAPFTPHNIELAKIIHKGEKIAIITSNNNLTVSMDGIAVTEGAIGETIKVKNISSKKIIDAQVAGQKKVTVVF
ncbi:MAG: flagellar basal body P-ring formation chaperone FlgA [Legionella sp.]|uniref:flagellar basal body P-ring formation chaperone FlgA n=1 Tax=Legionella sp. TaxID=459 RepID=UPI0039E7225C